MAWASIRIALAAGLIAAITVAGPEAQAQQVYRYVDKDGHVVYTDRAPPGDSKDVQAKRMRGNVIEDNTTKRRGTRTAAAPSRQRHREQRSAPCGAAGAGALSGDPLYVCLR